MNEPNNTHRPRSVHRGITYFEGSDGLLHPDWYRTVGYWHDEAYWWKFAAGFLFVFILIMLGVIAYWR